MTEPNTRGFYVAYLERLGRERAARGESAPDTIEPHTSRSRAQSRAAEGRGMIYLAMAIGIAIGTLAALAWALS
jgi:hypothetical protein